MKIETAKKTRIETCFICKKPVRVPDFPPDEGIICEGFAHARCVEQLGKKAPRVGFHRRAALAELKLRRSK